MGRTLLTANPHLRVPKARRLAVLRSVASSSAIEGIRAGAVGLKATSGPATRTMERSARTRREAVANRVTSRRSTAKSGR